jgi:hypothetical protein
MAESILPQSLSGPTVDPDHPWLGLHPFAEENHRYFFGRTAEVREIFLCVRENPLTVLYGQSGLGKTSLLRAGLIPKLRVERFRPVRVLLDFTERSAALVGQVRTALAVACAAPEGNAAALLDGWSPLASLWEICAHETIRPQDLAEQPPVLIIDQFEEVFTLAEQQQAAAGRRKAEVVELFSQIGDLVENRAPEALQKVFLDDPRRTLAYDSSPSAVRVVLSLREDYLAQLEQWKSTIPSLMRNRMPLRLLTGPQALEAVVRPGRMEGRNLISDQVGEQIVRFVAKRSADTPLEEIEAVPPLVSLVCEQLNEARLKQSPQLTEVSGQLVASQGADILQRFYDESFAGFPDSEREAVRECVEDRMVTVGGHRNPVARDDAVDTLARQGVSAPDNVLDALIHRRLLTAERRGGIQRLEIIHDVLTPLAVRGRKERQQRREIEQAKRKQAETEAQLARETGLRKQAKRRQLEAETQLHAVTAIGYGAPDDYKTAPTEHANSLEAKAPALSMILRGSELGTAASQYEEKDSEAIEPQIVFRKIAMRANWAVFFTTCFSAALLILPPLVHDSKWLILILGCSGILSGALGAMSLFKIRQGKLLETWMTRRARAEAERHSQIHRPLERSQLVCHPRKTAPGKFRCGQYIRARPENSLPSPQSPTLDTWFRSTSDEAAVSRILLH